MDRPTLTALLAPVVAPLELEIDRVDLARAGQRQIVRVFLDGDGADGRGPDLDQIAAATKAISQTLDQADMGPHPYVLEVSSRGVDAPLRTPAQFRRNVGRLARFTLTSGDAETARIASVTDGGVDVTTDSGDTKTLPFDCVVSAQVQVEFRGSQEEE